MFNIRQQDSECLLTPEAVFQIKRKLRKRRAENGQKQPLKSPVSVAKCQGSDDRLESLLRGRVILTVVVMERSSNERILTRNVLFHNPIRAISR
jgi:hypothetical protein